MVSPTSKHFQVTGDGHRGIGLSGVGRSALGSRLRIPAAVMGRDVIAITSVR